MSSPRTSVLSPVSRRTGPDMKREIRSQVKEQQLEGVQLTYCLCQKLNESGFLYNQRFLCIADGDFISYGKSIEENTVLPFKSMAEVPIKAKIIMEDLISYDIGKKQDDRWIKITFKEGKSNATWEFRLQTRLMCIKLKSRIQDSYEKCHRKKSQRPMEITRSEEQFDRSMFVPETTKVEYPIQQSFLELMKPEPVPQIKNQPEEPIEQQVIKQMPKVTFETPKKKERQMKQISQKQRQKQKEQSIVTEKSIQLSSLKNQIKKYQSKYCDRCEDYKNMNWLSKFLSTKDYHLTINQFNLFCEAVAVELIDQLFKPQIHRKYRPKVTADHSFQYDIPQFFMRLCWPVSPQEQVQIDPLESSMRQMRILQYILSKTKNQSTIKVPIATIIRYKGLSIYFKSKQQYHPELKLEPTLLQKSIEELSKLTNIEAEVLLSKTQYIFPLLNNKGLILQDVLNIFPEDPNHHPYQISPYLFRKIVRHKKRQREDYDQTLSKITMSPQLNKIDSKIQSLGLTSRLSENVIKQLIQDLELYIHKLVSPIDFIKIFKQFGCTLLDLPRLYKIKTVPFVRLFITTMMYLHAFIKVYNHRMSCQLKSLAYKRAPQIQKQSHLLSYGLGLINKVLFADKSNDQLWRNIIQVIEKQFNLQLKQDRDLNQSIFKNGVLYYTGIKLIINFAAPVTNLSRKQGVVFVPEIQSLDIAWTPFYANVKELLLEENETKDNFNSIVNKFSFKTNKLPRHILICSLHHQILFYLSNHISSLSQQFEHLMLYNNKLKNCPSWITFHLIQRNFVWHIRAKKQIEANDVKFRFKELLNSWCGEDHPLHLEIFKAQHHQLISTSPEDAVRIGKMLLIRALKHQNTIGSIKMSECYSLLAYTFLYFGKFEDALVHFLRCKSLIESKSLKNRQYYTLCLTISRLYLQFNQLQSFMKYIQQSYEYFQFKSRCEDEVVECFELLYRYHLLTSKYSIIYQLCQSRLPSFKKDNNLETIIKIITQISISKIEIDFRMKTIQYWRYQEQQKGFNLQVRQDQAVENIRDLIQRKIFTKKLELLYEKGQESLKKLLEVKRLPKWKQLISEASGEQEECLFLLQSLYYFLGEGWILAS